MPTAVSCRAARAGGAAAAQCKGQGHEAAVARGVVGDAIVALPCPGMDSRQIGPGDPPIGVSALIPPVLPCRRHIARLSPPARGARRAAGFLIWPGSAGMG